MVLLDPHCRSSHFMQTGILITRLILNLNHKKRLLVTKFLKRSVLYGTRFLLARDLKALDYSRTTAR